MSDLTAAMNEILAANIRTLRGRLGLKQDEFADELQISQATMSRWEKGAEPKGPNLAKLAELAGCSIVEFTTQLIPARPRVGDVKEATKNSSMILMPMLLPNEEALAQMFQALLDPLKNERNADVIARRLAQRLPTALAQTVSRAPVLQDGLNSPTPGAAAPSPRKASPERKN